VAAPGWFLLLFVGGYGMLTAGKHSFQRCQYSAGGWPLHSEGTSCPLQMKGGGAMSTSEVLQLCLVIIGICGLFLQARDKKK